MSTFRQAAAKMRNVAKNVDENAKIVVRQVALAIDQTLVLSTPVDTGRARANWQVEVDAIPEGSVGTFPKSAGTDSIGVAGLSGQFAMTNAIAATKGFAGGVIYIGNNLPYIIPLNDGHSKQAPSGFIQTAILNGIQAVEEIKFTEAPKNYGK